MRFLMTLLLLLTVSVSSASADPFSSCPSKAFLFQSTPVVSYGVNLVTGNYQLIEDDSGINANINGVGFDEFDRYLYGFNTTHLNVVRMGGDFQVETLNVSGLPENTSFFVGDVTNHQYYLYRKGVGLYKIDLSLLDSDVTTPLSAQLISSQSPVNLTDMAFHPNDGKLYGVDNKTGKLYQIDPTTGSTTEVGDTGETGTFGAMYFDVNGYFYLSRNQDGKIYRIDLSALTTSSSEADLTSLDVSAVHFADGPISTQNDGARCASAPLIDEDTPSTIDFGDAPATYKTLLADNGPRHLLDGETYLGLIPPDGDYDGYTGSDSDDSSIVNGESYDDEDGVNFVTAFEVGLDSVVSVYASGDGVLSAWFDWNRDGDFDDLDEQAVIDVELIAGQNIVALRVPAHAVAGNSWSRFRFSEQSGLGYAGGSSSGEVEDHAFIISESGVSYRYYPGEHSWVTLAYEDQWPKTDDYDMNDVVFLYRTIEVIQDESIVRIDIVGELQALGGDYRNGFAVQLENVLSSNVNQQTLRLLHNNIKQQYSGTNGATTYSILESGNSNAVLMVAQDLWREATSECIYYRTEKGCQQSQQFDFELSIPFIDAIPLNSVTAPYDPFIFATEGLYHGEDLGLHPGRGLEIHLVDKAPTEKFNSSYLGLSDDTSSPEIGRYFRNSNNLPWALELTEQWKWPSERKPLLLAYPGFQSFVESNGASNPLWFELNQAISTHLF
ncbi:MAG: LruC domain-containing protein [Psychromonas sp.]|nr:LruC domain-containing protein [Alteromonadales bacterium]MCP5079848.1 LruC domain-containing protein [Psychromonas sp.]